jgi:hypothetical protein
MLWYVITIVLLGGESRLCRVRSPRSPRKATCSPAASPPCSDYSKMPSDYCFILWCVPAIIVVVIRARDFSNSRDYRLLCYYAQRWLRSLEVALVVGGGFGCRRWLWSSEVALVVGGGFGHQRWLRSSEVALVVGGGFGRRRWLWSSEVALVIRGVIKAAGRIVALFS